MDDDEASLGSVVVASGREENDSFRELVVASYAISELLLRKCTITSSVPDRTRSVPRLLLRKKDGNSSSVAGSAAEAHVHGDLEA